MDGRKLAYNVSPMSEGRFGPLLVVTPQSSITLLALVRFLMHMLRHYTLVPCEKAHLPDAMPPQLYIMSYRHLRSVRSPFYVTYSFKEKRSAKGIQHVYKRPVDTASPPIAGRLGGRHHSAPF